MHKIIVLLLMFKKRHIKSQRKEDSVGQIPITHLKKGVKEIGQHGHGRKLASTTLRTRQIKIYDAHRGKAGGHSCELSKSRPASCAIRVPARLLSRNDFADSDVEECASRQSLNDGQSFAGPGGGHIHDKHAQANANNGSQSKHRDADELGAKTCLWIRAELESQTKPHHELVAGDGPQKK